MTTFEVRYSVMGSLPRGQLGVGASGADDPWDGVERRAGPPVELDRATRRRSFGRSIRELERLLALEMAQALDLQDAAGEDVLFPLLLNSEQSALDRRVWNSVHLRRTTIPLDAALRCAFPDRVRARSPGLAV